MTDPTVALAVPPTPSPVRPPRPATVRAAFWLYLGIVVLIAVGAVLGAIAVTDPALLAEARDAGGGLLDDDAIRITLYVGMGVGIAVAVIEIALYALFAGFLLRGAGWARVVLTVLSGLAVAGGLFTVLVAAIPGTTRVSTPISGLSTALDLLGAVVAAAAIVLMYLPPSNAWFRAVKAARTPAW